MRKFAANLPPGYGFYRSGDLNGMVTSTGRCLSSCVTGRRHSVRYGQEHCHATEAYKSAWADGEPYVYRWSLERARSLLLELGTAIPELPAYDGTIVVDELERVDLGKMKLQLIANVENQDRAQCGENEAGGMISIVCRARKHVGNAAADVSIR